MRKILLVLSICQVLIIFARDRGHVGFDPGIEDPVRNDTIQDSQVVNGSHFRNDSQFRYESDFRNDSFVQNDSQEKNDQLDKKNIDFVLGGTKWTLGIPIWIPGFRGDLAYGDISTYPVQFIEEEDPPRRFTSSGLEIRFYLIGIARFEHRRFFVQADGFKATFSSSLTFFDIDRLQFEGTLEGAILKGYAGYKVFQKINADRHFMWSLNVYGGVRYYDVHAFSNDIERLDIRPTWTDPVMGIEFPVIVRQWVFSAQGDYGGLGGGDHRSWYANAQARYRFSRLFSLGAGWSFLDVKYDKEFENKDLLVNMQLTGPQVHIQFHF